MNIAIQGIKGSFHHLVANEFFGENITIKECSTFSEIPELLKNGAVDAAVMAIENSNIGDILSNFGLIDKFNLNIAGEYYLPMRHNLMALKGQKIEDIKEVWSHPIALKDCERFFRLHPNLRIVEEKDTATAAALIHDQKIKGVAAIASKKAAEIYELEILEEDIHDNDGENITRFFVLTKERKHHENDYLNNKATLKFTTELKLNNLSEILDTFVKHQLQLIKIQSFPIQNEPWNYAFFIDIMFHEYHEYCQALLNLEKKVIELKILGEYKENVPIKAEILV